MLQFNAEQLGHAILELQQSNFSGVAYVETLSDAAKLQRPKVLTFLNGALTYGGLYLPEPRELSRELGKHFNLQVMDAAFQLASKKVKNPASIRQHLELYIRLELFSWEAVESFIRNQLILVIEQIWLYGGNLKLNTSAVVDLSFGQDNHGFLWQQLEQDIIQRQRVWASLLPHIGSINAVPCRVENYQQTITDPWVQQHLQRWIDGHRTLGTIASEINRDPLELAHSYVHFVQMGWLTFTPRQDNYRALVSRSSVVTPTLPDLPTILSVDDSPVVQAMIKRAIGDRYHLLLANNAMDALNLLNRENIELLLLDVTMPDIDGLELCRTIRNINKFRNLPVIMLTAKDGMFNKIKGQMAGSTHYLTKPINRKKLIEVLEKYISNTVMS